MKWVLNIYIKGNEQIAEEAMREGFDIPPTQIRR